MRLARLAPVSCFKTRLEASRKFRIEALQARRRWLEKHARLRNSSRPGAILAARLRSLLSQSASLASSFLLQIYTLALGNELAESMRACTCAWILSLHMTSFPSSSSFIFNYRQPPSRRANSERALRQVV